MEDKTIYRVSEGKVMRDKPQIISNSYGTFCDTFNCTNPATYLIGRPDGPLDLCYQVCDKCLADILQSISIRPDVMLYTYGIVTEVIDDPDIPKIKDPDDPNAVNFAYRANNAVDITTGATTNATAYLCPICKAEFATQRALQVHIGDRGVHTPAEEA